MKGNQRVGSRVALAGILSLLLLAGLIAPLCGQTVARGSGEPASDDDEVFSTAMVLEVEETGQSLAGSLVSTAETEIGGAFLMDAMWSTSLIEAAPVDFGTELSMDLFIDARPDEDFRMYGKATLSYPFETGDTRMFQDIVAVKELFADMDWEDSIFFRVGKQTVNWGVGRFFSPANLINLADIDPEDPDGQLEGPVAFKAHFPFGAHNLYAYLLPQGASELDDIGVAVKAEFALDGTEYTFGALYDRDTAPAAMSTVSTRWGDFDLFAEATLSLGTDRLYVRQTQAAPYLEAYALEAQLLFSGTFGLMYEYDFSDSDSKLRLAAQYLYNGDGYADTSVVADNWTAVRQLIQGGALTSADLAYRGRHYSALDLRWTDVFGSESGLDVNGKILWIQNYTDMSARIVPEVELKVPHLPRLTIGLPITRGDRYDEFSPDGNTMALQIRVAIDEDF